MVREFSDNNAAMAGRTVSWFMSLNDVYRKKIRKPYYYVPKCPKCGSRVTGRFVRARNDNDAEWLIDESLRNGEIVSPMPKVLSENCFCCECNATFKADTELRWLNLDELDKEKIDRNIYDIWLERRNASDERAKEPVLKRVWNHLV